MKIATLVFFGNGAVWALDRQGQHVVIAEEPAWLTVIMDKLRRDLVDDKTLVKRQHYRDMTVGEIRAKILQGPGRGVKNMQDNKLKIEINGECGPNALPTEVARFKERFQGLVGELKTQLGWNGVATFAIGQNVTSLTEPVHA